MAWWFSSLAGPKVPATSSLIVFQGDGPNEEIRIEGAGFTFDANGFLNGGTISALKLYNGTNLMQTVAFNLSAAAVAPYLSAAKAISDVLQSWPMPPFDESQNEPDFAGNTVVVRLKDQSTGDLSYLRITFSDANPNVDVRTVTAIDHLGSDQSTVLHSVPANLLNKPAYQVFEAFDGSYGLYHTLLSGPNMIVEHAGNYMTLSGGAGDDYIIGNVNGRRSLDYDDEVATGGVTANLLTGVATGAGIGTDTLINIDNIEGGTGSGDNFTGNNSTNYLSGDGGNDNLFGLDGDDYLSGGLGNDLLDGGAGSQDVAVYYENDDNPDVTAGVTVNLSLSGQQNTGGAGLDTLTGIEGVVGTKFNDTLTGDGQDNLLVGNEGNDVLNGGVGADEMYGGAGNDTYHVDNIDDLVNEHFVGGAFSNGSTGGIDTVNASVDFDLNSNEIENLTFVANGATGYTGHGNDINNTINGAGGIDYLVGKLGADTIRGGAAGDTIYGEDETGGTPPPASGISFGSGTVTAPTGHHSLATALNVSNLFSLSNDSDIIDSTTIPHVSISATGANAVDYYRITINNPNARLTFDIDHGFGDENTNLVTRLDLYNAQGNHFWSSTGSDQSNGAGGSTSWTDSFIGGVNFEPGTYIVAVSQLSNFQGGDTFNTPLEAILTGRTYELQISVENEIVSTNDTLYGEAGDDFISGGIGNDLIVGGDGIDTMDGGAGSDNLYGGLGADAHIGGDDAGIDYARYDDANYGDLSISLNQAALANAGAAAVGDTYVGIEGLVGGAGNDQVFGDANNNYLYGGAGNDQMQGRAGTDYVNGGAGNDQLWGGPGGDTLVGGDGIDYARYDEFGFNGGFFPWGNLTIRLDAPNLNTGIAVGDTYSSIEGLVGGIGNDTIVGNGANNYLFGHNGNDLIFGLNGNDYLNGGAGADKFVFNTALNATTNVDTIADFTVGVDDFWLGKTIFTMIGTALTADELVTGTAAADANDFLIYNSANGRLYYDADGSGSGGAIQFATVTAGTALTVGDFVMV